MTKEGWIKIYNAKDGTWDKDDLIDKAYEIITSLNVELVGMRGACESYKLHYENAQAEIERFKEEVKELHKVCDKAIKTYKEATSEARKEFWEKLKEKRYGGTYPYVLITEGDNLLKEMEGEE